MTTDAMRQELEVTVQKMKQFADEIDAKGAMSPADRSQLDQYGAKVSSLVAQIKAYGATSSAYVPDEAQQFFRSMSPDQLGSAFSGALDFGSKAAQAVKAAGGELGIKALLSGTVDVPSPITTDVVRTAQVPTSFLDLITNRRPIDGTNTFNYLKQTVRTNNAAPVADGAVKPTSVYTVQEVEDRVRVIAHLSEAIPERYLADHRELQRFLEVEMRAGLMLALESQVATGSGTGENMTGLLTVSGTTAVAFATDTLTTARKAVTALQNIGEQPNAWVLNPADNEAFDLLKSTTGEYLREQGDALWRLPRVVSAKVPAGTAILGDWRYAQLVIRQNATLAAGQPGDLFTRNQVQLRLEGRYGFAVLRPSAFAIVDLTA